MIDRRRAAMRAGAVGAVLVLLGAAAMQVHPVIQKGRAFNLADVAIAVGDTVEFENQDEFLHQIYVKSDAFNFESAEQPPGENVPLRFPVAGTFEVLCEIHPKMHLTVTVK